MGYTICMLDKQAYMHARERTHTHKYVIFIAFPRSQWFRERATVLRYTYIACLVATRNCARVARERHYCYQGLTSYHLKNVYRYMKVTYSIYADSYFRPILTKLTLGVQILATICYAKFHGSPSNNSQVVHCGETDRQTSYRR